MGNSDRALQKAAATAAQQYADATTNPEQRAASATKLQDFATQTQDQQAAAEAARAATEALHAKAAGGGAAPSPSADTCDTGWYATSLAVENSPWLSGGHCPDPATHPKKHAAFIEAEAKAQQSLSSASSWHFG